MFGMQHTFKQLSGGIAVAAVVAIAAVPSAFSMTRAVPYVNGGMSAAVAQSNQQPLRASLPFAYGGMSVAVAQSNQTSGQASNASPYAYGGNSAQFAKTIESPYAYGGNSPRFATGIQDKGLTSAPSVTANPSGFNWKLGGGIAAGVILLLLLIGGQRPRQNRRSVRTA